MEKAEKDDPLNDDTEPDLQAGASPAQQLTFRRVEDEHGRLVEEVAPAVRQRPKRKRRRRVHG